jgi:hypothetical protein
MCPAVQLGQCVQLTSLQQPPVVHMYSLPIGTLTAATKQAHKPPLKAFAQYISRNLREAC